MINKNQHQHDLDDLRLKYKVFLNADEVEKLELEIQKPNIFNILGISRMEIRHSNFLGWLLDPNGSHGLRNKFLVRILRDLALEDNNDLDIVNISNLNFNNVDVYREYPISLKDEDKNTKGFIDILIIFRDENDKYIICIENKIDSTDFDGQLPKYEEYVKDTFKVTDEYKHIFVYLTPNGNNCNDKQINCNDKQINCNDKQINKWSNYSYKDGIIENLTHSQESTTDTIVKTYISDYLSILKNEIMGKQDEAQQLANAIYENHKEIIDFVVANRDANIEYQKNWEKDFPSVYNFAQKLIKLIQKIDPTNEYKLGYVKNAITVKQKTKANNRFYNIYSIYARDKNNCNLEFTFSNKEKQDKIKEAVKKIVDTKKKVNSDSDINYSDSSYFNIFSVINLKDNELLEIHKIRFGID